MAVVVVGITDTQREWAQYRSGNGVGEWVTFASAPAQMVRDYRVTNRGTKLAIAPDGEVLRRSSLYSANTQADWEGVRDLLLSSVAPAQAG